MRRRRAGRPRKQHRRRTARGILVREDGLRPTPELLRYRRALVGEQADPRLAESPLGVLLARGLISEEERLAGQRFAWLHRLAFGRSSVAASDPLRPPELLGAGPETPPLGAGQAAWLAAREAEMDRARAELQDCGAGAYRAVQAAAVVLAFPDWMAGQRPLTPAEEAGLRDLQRGLACLADCFGFPRQADAQPERGGRC